MFVQHVNLGNFRGRTTLFELGRTTLIAGDNFTGKTTIADAIRLALSGYLPGVGKTGGDLFNALAGNPDEPGEVFAEVTMDNGRSASLKLTKSVKGSVSTEGAPPVDMALAGPLLDVRAFFTMKAADRVAAIFQASGVASIDTEGVEKALWEITANPAKVRDAEVRRLIELAKTEFGKAAPQVAVSTLLDKIGVQLKEAKAKAKVLSGAFAGMKLPATMPTEPKGMEELEAKRTALLEIQGRITEMKRRESGLENLKATLAEAEKNLEAAKEVLAKATKPGEPPKPPELLEAYTNARPQLAQLSGELDELTTEEASLREQLKSLEGVTVCPTCGAQRDLSKVTEGLRSRLTGITEAVKKQTDALAAAEAPFEGIETVAASYEVAIEEHGNAVKAFEDIVANADSLASMVAKLKEELARSRGASPDEIAKLEACVSELPAVEAERQKLQVQAEDWRAYQKVIADREKAETDMLAEDCRVTVLDGAQKAVNKLLKTAAEEAFGEVLKLSHAFTEGLLQSPLEFRNGELGRRGNDGGWITHESFSGTEQLLAYAGFAVALARTAPFKLVVLDEMGRLAPDRRAAVAKRMVELTKAGTVDQVLMIDATPPGSAFTKSGKDLIDATYKPTKALTVLTL